MPIVEFEEQRYEFPEDATEEEIATALNEVTMETEETIAEDEPVAFREEETIERDEGIRRSKEGSHVSYRDGKVITGGIGHQLSKEELETYPRGTAIPDDVVANWFKTDMEEANTSLTRILEKKKVRVPDEVFDVLLNMSFNLGEKNLLEFDDMWSAVEVGDWQTVSDEMRDSKWAKDVKNRAVRLADRMANVKSIKQQPATE